MKVKSIFFFRVVEMVAPLCASVKGPIERTGW